MKMLLKALFVLPLVASLSAHANETSEEAENRFFEKCQSLILAVAQDLKLKGVEETDEHWRPYQLDGIVAAACKAEPQDKNNFIVAFATPTKKEYLKTLFVAVVDGRNEKVLAHYKGDFEEDAILNLDSSSLRIDTANYRLNPSTRAFGLDVISPSMPSCAEGGFGPLRILYVREGKKIRPILEGVYLSTWNYIQQGQSRCNYGPGVPEESIIANYTTTISMAPTMTNGYHDIMLNFTSSRDDIPSSKERLKSSKIAYDGKKYPIENGYAWSGTK